MRQRGAALLVVLWACTLLAILLGGFAAMARLEGEQARYLAESTRAHYAAEAAVMRAIQGLLAARQNGWGGSGGQTAPSWRFDGWPYHFNEEGIQVSVATIDERGKVDLNQASPNLLQSLFRFEGLNAAAARALAQAVVVWRSRANGAQQQTRAAYLAAGRDAGPRYGPFASIEELAMVLGMTPELYAKLAPLVTLWSRQSMPNPALAPLPVLAALPGVGLARATQYYAQRMQNPSARAGAAFNGEAGIGGGVANAGARRPGAVVSISAEAVLADGVRSNLQVTVRLQGASDGGRPYQVLRWQEGVEP